MIGIIFLFFVCIGIYLLLRSRYENLSVGKYMAYSIAVIIIGVIVMAVALTLGRGMPHIANRAAARIANGVVNGVLDARDVQIIELNADDLDPQIQDALLAAVRRRERRRQLTTEDILDLFEKKEAPQEGVCGVCYDGLEDGDLLACPECHKIAHKTCLKDWIESGQNVCIYCRYNLVLI